MRGVITVVLLLALGATPALAQQDAGDRGARSLTKILIGAGALAVGTAVAAKSSQTTTVTSAVGASKTSTFSKSQLITGLSVAGVGGIVLWDALRSHDDNRPSTKIGVGVAARTRTVFIQRAW